MKVYVLTAVYDYEGEQVLGVYATEADAVSMAGPARAKFGADDVAVYEIEVGAEMATRSGGSVYG